MIDFRYIVSGPSDGAGNMAEDEAVFTSLSRGPLSLPVIRVYRWRKPCMTIGYFQKYADFEGRGLEITRRLTGGLSVAHGSDVSYSFALPGSAWPCIYDQTRTYQLVHDGIRAGLGELGIAAEFHGTSPAASAKTGLCVQTLFPYDLLHRGRKIVGSCQRRRGSFLLLQGSLHLPSPLPFEAVAASLGKGWGKALFATLSDSSLSDEERILADGFRSSRYLRDDWNKKF